MFFTPKLNKHVWKLFLLNTVSIFLHFLTTFGVINGKNFVSQSTLIQSPRITKMAIPVSWFSEIESSNDAGTLELSVSSTRVLSATGRECSVEFSPQYRHRQITSSPDRTAALYCSLVIPVSQRRCCHLSQPSHSSASWRDVTISVQKMQ